MKYFCKKKPSALNKAGSLFIAVVFAFTSVVGSTGSALAQAIPQLPAPGVIVNLSPVYTPVLLKGVKIHPEDPFRFNFIIDVGDTELNDEELKQESAKLIKYFLAALTLPEEEMWVNLSPYEEDRIIAIGLDQTDMGRDMLAQDYILKQIMSSLTYPEEEMGKQFWTRVYEQAYEMYGTTAVPLNTFNKVWIIPHEAEVLEEGDTAMIAYNELKVMLEEDYIALRENIANQKLGTSQLAETDVEEISNISSLIAREILIPEIEREVNEGKNFAQVRQIYHSLILATWYKQALRESLLSQIYVDQKKVKGVDLADKEINDRIYEQYVAAFKKGVYDLIKEDLDEYSNSIVTRQYFSGGVLWEGTRESTTIARGRENLSARGRAGVDSTNPTRLRNVDSKADVQSDRGTLVISSDDDGGTTTLDHHVYHRKGRFKPAFNGMVNRMRNAGLEIRETFETDPLTGQPTTRYDLIEAVTSQFRGNGTEFTVPESDDGSEPGIQVRVERWTGLDILVVVNPEFRKNHAGLGENFQLGAYGNNEVKVAHEIAELKAWIVFMRDVMQVITNEEIRQGLLRERIQELERENKALYDEKRAEFHEVGLQAEAEIRLSEEDFAEMTDQELWRREDLIRRARDKMAKREKILSDQQEYYSNSIKHLRDEFGEKPHISETELQDISFIMTQVHFELMSEEEAFVRLSAIPLSFRDWDEYAFRKAMRESEKVEGLLKRVKEAKPQEYIEESGRSDGRVVRIHGEDVTFSSKDKSLYAGMGADVHYMRLGQDGLPVLYGSFYPRFGGTRVFVEEGFAGEQKVVLLAEGAGEDMRNFALDIKRRGTYVLSQINLQPQRSSRDGFGQIVNFRANMFGLEDMPVEIRQGLTNYEVRVPGGQWREVLDSYVQYIIGNQAFGLINNYYSNPREEDIFDELRVGPRFGQLASLNRAGLMAERSKESRRLNDQAAAINGTPLFGYNTVHNSERKLISDRRSENSQLYNRFIEDVRDSTTTSDPTFDLLVDDQIKPLARILYDYYLNAEADPEDMADQVAQVVAQRNIPHGVWQAMASRTLNSVLRIKHIDASSRVGRRWVQKSRHIANLVDTLRRYQLNTTNVSTDDWSSLESLAGTPNRHMTVNRGSWAPSRVDFRVDLDADGLPIYTFNTLGLSDRNLTFRRVNKHAGDFYRVVAVNGDSESPLVGREFEEKDVRKAMGEVVWAEVEMAVTQPENVRSDLVIARDGVGIRPSEARRGASDNRAPFGSRGRNVGGIDFNPDLMSLEIKRDGAGMPLPIIQQEWDGIEIQGLTPIIINITPVTIQAFPILSSIESDLNYI